jgi:hypothetical protein
MLTHGRLPPEVSKKEEEDSDKVLAEVYDLIGVIIKRENVNPHAAASSILVALLMNAVHMGADGFVEDDVMRELTLRMAQHLRLPHEMFCLNHKLMLGSEYCDMCQELGDPVKSFVEIDEEE